MACLLTTRSTAQIDTSYSNSVGSIMASMLNGSGGDSTAATAVKPNTAGSIDTDVTYSVGFQPSFAAITNAWIACFGSAKITNVSAPDAFSCCTCESTVGSSSAYDWVATICFAWAPRPRLSPASSYWPYSSFS